jgi:HK97 family phage prohead protease
VKKFLKVLMGIGIALIVIVGLLVWYVVLPGRAEVRWCNTYLGVMDATGQDLSKASPSQSQALKDSVEHLADLSHGVFVFKGSSAAAALVTDINASAKSQTPDSILKVGKDADALTAACRADTTTSSPTGSGSAGPTLTGHFAVFDSWAEIDSKYEGHFMERVAPGAFRDTFANDRSNIKVLFQHGRDPQVGNKVLGPIEVLEEDTRGAAYAVPLLDTSYNADLLPGLRAGLYGSSFRFTVGAEDRLDRPQPSEYNPDSLPERTITQAKVFEFGPCTFPAYDGATAGVRSLTDWYRSGEPGVRAVIWTPARRRAALLTA